MGPTISQALCDRARRLYEVHPERVVIELTGICSASLSRIRRRGWQAFPKGFKQRPRPNDFAIQNRYMTGFELAAHYRTSNAIIARWRRELRALNSAPCIGRRG